MYNKKFYLDQELISYVLVIVFGLIVFLFIQDPNESFFINYDQEFWNTYNSLLIYSELEQELYNDPGHISYLLFAIYLKIVNLFNIIEVPTIFELNQTTQINEKIQNLVFHSRIFGFFVNIILTFLIIKLFKKFKSKYIIFFTIILLTSNGFLTHISQYRVESMTLLLMIIALLILISFIEKKEKIYLKLFFFNFFIILSIINKVQIIFYIPFYLLILLHYKKPNFYLTNNLKFLTNNKKKLIWLLSSTLIMIFFIILRSEQIHSIVYFTIMYLIFLISFFCIVNFNDYKNLTLFFNFILLFAFLIIYLMVVNITLGGDRVFWVFFKISKIRGYLGDVKLLQSDDSVLWIKEFIEFGILNFKKLILKFLEFKKDNIIIFTVLIFTIMSNNLKKYYNLNLFIILYIIIKFITLFRSDAFYYQIYFDWLVILGLIIFFNNFKLKNFIKYSILSLILIVNLYKNFNSQNFNTINSGSYSKEVYCSDDQIYSEMGIWYYFTSRIEKNTILVLCDKY
jgi:hypothetical protein